MIIINKKTKKFINVMTILYPIGILMRKVEVFIVICMLVLVSLAGSACISSDFEEGKVRLVTTFYPLAYFSEEIGGDYVSVQSLIPYNSEVHSWQPSTSDILAADDADILVYCGTDVDRWFEEDLLPSIEQENKIIVEAIDGVELLEVEVHEGEHGHGEHDPHVWISPFVAEKLAENIYDALVEKDPDHETYYSLNRERLKERFDETDNDYMDGLADKKKEDIFVTHAAYGYLADRYGFHQHGVIGLSADEQPGAAAIADLADEMMVRETYVVFVDPVYSDEYANTLKSELESRTGEEVEILKLYLMLGPVDGKDYFGQLETNLDNLKTGLEA